MFFAIIAMILKVNIVITEMEKVLAMSSIFSVVMVFLVAFLSPKKT